MSDDKIEAQPPTSKPSNDDSSKDEVIDGIPVPNELLEKLPPDVRQQIITFMLHQQRIGVPTNPIAAKITAEHIDKVILSAEKDSERNHEDRRADRRYGALYVSIFVTLFVFLVIFLIDRRPEMLLDLVKYVAVFFGGFGVKSYLDRNKQDE